MNEKLQTVIDLVKNRPHISEEEKFAIIDTLTIQNRNLEIEAALEQIRSRSLAMQRSDELKDVVDILFVELKELGLVFDGRAAIHLFAEKSRDAIIWVASPELPAPICNNLPYDEAAFVDNSIILDVWKAKDTGVHILNKSYSFEEKNKYFDYVFKYNKPIVPEAERHFIRQTKSYTATFIAEKNSLLGANSWTGQQFSEDGINVLKRVASVFEQAYIRFLDLQKAEAQAREARIEAALEKVRSRSLAMHQSNELQQVVSVVFKQLNDLGISFDGVSICTFVEGKKDIIFWVAVNEDLYSAPVYFPYFEHPVPADFWKAKAEGIEYYAKTYTVEEKNSLWTYNFQNTDFKNLPEERKKMILESPGYTFTGAWGNKSAIAVNNFAGRLFSKEDSELIKRFAKAFDQAYIRFLDLQKAESQAREAQIEASLEKVRSKTMAMHSSDELGETASVLFRELKILGVVKQTDRINISIVDEEKYVATVWATKPGGEHRLNSYNLPIDELETIKKRWDEFLKLPPQQRKETLIVTEYRGKEIIDFRNFIAKYTDLLEDSVMRNVAVEKFYQHSAGFSHGSLEITGFQKLDEEAQSVFKRFAVVFEQTYTRFKDLQKVESQTREARIEAALEKVRSKTMAMHSSNELGETASVLFQELKILNVVKQIDRINIAIVDEEKHVATIWATKPGGEHRLSSYCLPIDELEPVKKRWDEFLKLPRQQRKETLIVTEYTGKEIIDFRNFVAKYTDLMEDSLVLNVVVEKFYQHSAGFSHGSLDINGFEKLDEEAQAIFKRFAVVFEQTYTRFRDLQRAEAQAKEAKIEAALERVRSRAMAMHNSNDVGNAIGVLFLELEHLGIATIRCGIVIMNGSKTLEAWGAISTKEGKIGQIIGNVDIGIHPLYEGAYEAWKQKKPFYTYELAGQDFLNYYNAVSNSTDYKIPASYLNGERHICNFFIFKEGGLFTFTKDHFDASTSQVLERFTAVFALTYRRYLDLKQAEEQSRQAVRQAVLDRIRAEIASMRTTTDLERITPLIWNELTILHVPFTRCGVFIMNENEGHLDVYLSNPEGKAIAAFQLPINNEGLTPHLLSHWKNNQTFTDYWDAATFSAWTKSLSERGGIKSQEKYNSEKVPENLYLHFLPFLQGMLYVGNTAPLTKEDLQLVQSLAQAFSAAYARYEDFRKLENAKQQIEKTLSELKSTQVQLIQSAKMASLGELTAGVAHEIQNPLNFVNNFSEVSTELVAEMKDALRKGEKDEAITLANDVIENLKKISHHGKRADAIVKGMLQHSRASTGKKEPTDINALADEYLRLSFYGLRAKDKDFNAEFKTNFDESIGKIEVVPQDIGRFLLNLYNNAFYSASLPSKGGLTNKSNPTVWVSTKKEDDKIVIRVRDNGPGIPQEIVDKIFQPFFTTKPTGQGTGLGLSLSYDIIKAHGGELKVETKEGEGAEFVVQLPGDNNT